MSLFRMSFQLTNRCNLDCRHCLRDQNRSHPQDLPLPLFRKIAEQAISRYGIRYFAFTGGEVLLYPRLRELFEFLVGKDAAFTFVSNGFFIPSHLSLLTEPEIKKKLTSVAISLEGHNEETHDAIRGSGSYRRALAAVAALSAAGIPVVIKYTIGRHNLDHLEEAILGFSHLGADRVEMAPMMPTPDNVAAGIMPDPEECRRAEAVVYRMMKELRMKVHMTSGVYVPYSFYSCAYLAMVDLYVDYRGRLAVCCMLPDLRGQGRDKTEPEIVADLAEMDLWEAHGRLIRVISAFQQDRVNKIARGQLADNDRFQCIACARYFGKMNWLDALPENPWSKAKEKEEPAWPNIQGQR